MAEEEGFEPPRVVKLLLVFETSPFSLLGIPPVRIIIAIMKNKIHDMFSNPIKFFFWSNNLFIYSVINL